MSQPSRNLNNKAWLKAHILDDVPAALTAYNESNFKGDESQYMSQEDCFTSYTIPQFSYDGPSYLWASRELKLCTLQEVSKPEDAQLIVPSNTLAGGVMMGTLEDGHEDIIGGAQVNFAVQQWGEGDNPWVILQSSVDDAMGVWMAQKVFLGDDKQAARRQLFSEETFNALMMVDFWNPIYSWRRLKLMQYIPVEAKLVDKPTIDPVTGEEVYTYDLEQNFIRAIEQRMEGKGDLKKLEDEWPEAEFLLNLKRPLIEHQIRISNYTNAVANNLQNSQWLLQYLKLAESRRRMFRPMPMNFFGSNIPYCLAMTVTDPWLEMTETGTVQEINKDGTKILRTWLGSLAGNDPNVIPEKYQGLDNLSDITDVMKERLENDHPALPVPLLPRPSTMRMACQRSIAITNPETKERPHSCPFLADKHLTSQHPAISA
ncbi:hypothetical protein NW766_010495 [Fusarium irregulare]|uniref:Uncharacterized protein n=1 Tax=Fusarium irregulare TaxID=2494466 RepID=A0A9W8PHT8_9HYPO|nr:hypothetical protein NW766_010495 [Fusarium irregulare]